MPIPSSEDYMTVEQCAAVVHMTPAGFRRMCSDGKLPCVKIGRRYLIRTSDFEAWLAQKEAASKPVTLAGGRVHPASEPRPDDAESRSTSGRESGGMRGDAPAPLRVRVIG